MVACAPVATVVYKLVLEGLAPEANDERVRGFLARIFGDKPLSPLLSENFPCEVPGEFDFQRASEWMEALARAGVRSRVEITGTLATAPRDDQLSAPWLPPAAKTPLKLWLELLSKPEAAYTWLAAVGPLPGLLMGLILICLGNVLAYPGELWVFYSLAGLDVIAAPAFKSWLTLVLLEPFFRLLVESLVLAVTVRLLGAKISLTQAAAIAGPAHAADLLKAIPFVGAVVSWFVFLWLTAVGLTTQGHLDNKRSLIYVLLPFVGLFLAFASLMLLFAGLLGSLDAGALASHLASELDL